MVVQKKQWCRVRIVATTAAATCLARNVLVAERVLLCACVVVCRCGSNATMMRATMSTEYEVVDTKAALSNPNARPAYASDRWLKRLSAM